MSINDSRSSVFIEQEAGEENCYDGDCQGEVQYSTMLVDLRNMVQ